MIVPGGAGCKSGILPSARPEGPRAKAEPVSEMTEELSDFRLIEIELPKNASGTPLSEEFLRGIADRTVETLAALWLFEIVTAVDEAETGRELAPTLLIRTNITGVGEAGKIGPLASGHHVTADVTFIEKKTGRSLGVYRLEAPAKGDPPFGEGNTGAFTRFSLTITDILEDHARRAVDKRWGG
jgi:hypothetical protein